MQLAELVQCSLTSSPMNFQSRKHVSSAGVQRSDRQHNGGSLADPSRLRRRYRAAVCGTRPNGLPRPAAVPGPLLNGPRMSFEAARCPVIGPSAPGREVAGDVSAQPARPSWVIAGLSGTLGLVRTANTTGQMARVPTWNEQWQKVPNKVLLK